MAKSLIARKDRAQGARVVKTFLRSAVREGMMRRITFPSFPEDQSLRVWGLEFRARDLEFCVYVFGLRRMGFTVWGVGFTV